MVSNFVTSCARFIIVLTIVGGSASYADDLHQRLIEAGREQFTQVRRVSTSVVDATQDSNRFFNARSCAECHRQGGIGGAGPNRNNVQLVDGKILHRFGTSPKYAKARLEKLMDVAPNDPEVIRAREIELERRPLGSREVGYCDCGVGVVRHSFEERNTPALFGLGQIALIPQQEIQAVAESQPKTIRGRSPRLRGGGVGRFGWKAQVGTLADFNEGACAAELGLKTARFVPQETVTMRYRSPDTWRARREPNPRPAIDMTTDDLAALTMFVSSLPEPTQVVDLAGTVAVAEGSKHFATIGCAVCHVRDVGTVKGLYSDLLLHSVGTSGAAFYYSPTEDPTKQFDIVLDSEMRTPPLWGVADSAPYLHDGSAATLEEAILKHSEQAEQSTEAYRKLGRFEKDRLLAFLRSLRAPGAADWNGEQSVAQR